MSPQLQAALTRSLIQAVVAGLLAYIGGGVVTDSAVDEAVDDREATPATAPTTTTTLAGQGPTDDTGADTSDEQLSLAIAAAVALLVGRGLVEGIYDTRRNEKGDVKQGDVGSDPAGAKAVGTLWARANDQGDDRLLVVAARKNNQGKTEYLLAEGDNHPIWRGDDEVSGFKVGKPS